jgi:hypothetical protein
MEKAGQRLGELVKGMMYRGVLTGLNEAFIIDRATRDRLVAEDPKSAEILKPLVVGDDARRYEVHYREQYLIWTYIGVPIKQYPAVFRHLKQFQARAEKRWDKGEHWWELRACDFYDAFGEPKVVYPDIGMEGRFAIDDSGSFVEATAFIIPRLDWWLLAVLNSSSALNWLKATASILGDEDKRGRVRFKNVYMEPLPIPEVTGTDNGVLTRLAQRGQESHTKRRRRVEEFLHDIGTSPAESSSTNMLEQPWNTEKCTDDYFRKKAKGYPLKLLSDVRDETIAMNLEIKKVENEIDERVKSLYGL